MRHSLLGLLLACLGTASLAQDAAAPANADPAAFAMDRSPFVAMCQNDEYRKYLKFDHGDACLEQVNAAAVHCDKSVAKDFGAMGASMDADVRKSFLTGVAQGCFMVQMNVRSNGKFVELLQLLAKNDKK